MDKNILEIVHKQMCYKVLASRDQHQSFAGSGLLPTILPTRGSRPMGNSWFKGFYGRWFLADKLWRVNELHPMNNLVFRFKKSSNVLQWEEEAKVISIEECGKTKRKIKFHNIKYKNLNTVILSFFFLSLTT